MNKNKQELRVCSYPTHIDARRVKDKVSWYGIQQTFVYDTNPKSNSTIRSLAYGISKDSG